MAKDIDNVVSGGGDDSGVWVADKGTTLPTDLAAPGAGFGEVGWLSEDGIGITRAETRSSLTAHQGGKVIKRKVTSVEDGFTFQCLETNAIVMGLLYKGATQTTTTGVTHIAVTDQTINDERAWVVDEKLDDGTTMRYVYSAGAAEQSADVTYTQEGPVYEFTVTSTGTFDVYTDAVGVVAAG